MTSGKSGKKRKPSKRSYIFAGISIVFIAIAVVLSWRELRLSVAGLSANIAAAFLAVVILSFIYSKTGGEPLKREIEKLEEATEYQKKELQDQINEFENVTQQQKTEIQGQIKELERVIRQLNSLTETAIPLGLVAVYMRPSVLRRWAAFLDYNQLAGRKKVDIIVRQLRHIGELTTDDEQREKLKRKIDMGYHVHMLVLDTGDPELSPGIERVITDILRHIDHNRNQVEGSFRFARYKITPGCSIVRIGGNMYVTDYLYGIPENLSPTYLVREGPLFDKYIDYFKHVWEAPGTREYILKNKNGTSELVQASEYEK